MSDYCNFCETRRPESGTNILVLGENWFEFCRPCGTTEMLTNGETGEQKSFVDVFNEGEQMCKWQDEVVAEKEGG